MDIREKIIQKVIQELEGRVEETVMDAIQDILVIELNHYEVTERCTEIELLDNSAEKILKKFLATKRVEGIAESTLQRYADENLKLIRFLGKPVFEITAYDIRFYLSYRREKSEVKLSNRTLDGIRRCYSSFFGWLSTEGLIQQNPCASIKQIKYRKKVKRPYTAAEMEKLRMACESTRDLALLDFLYCTGCRVSEVAKLNVEDIDFERMECTVLGKGNKERTVYLSEVAGMHLKNYLSERKDQKEALFAGKGTERLGKNGIESLLKRIGAKAEVSNVHPHRYRRTLATNLLDRGMNIQDVAAILGHADLKTTQIYCYISQKNVKTAYNKYAV